MNEINMPSDELQDLLDDYVAGRLDEAETAHLEQVLLADPAARDCFVRYCRLHTDLHLLGRANAAGRRVLETITAGEGAGGRPAGTKRHMRLGRWIAIGAALAACVLLAFTMMMQRQGSGQAPAIAWLINAQNCQWVEETKLAGGLQAGQLLRLDGGLAEIRFASGASVVLEGPARLELLSGRSARLLRGKLAANVPEPARGFQILTPQGRIVDLGTEFGMTVAEDGLTDVHVFAGQVEAFGAGSSKVGLGDGQSARIAGGAVTRSADAVAGAAGVVRAIAPSPVVAPRTWALDFRRPVPGTLLDGAGQGTGLTHRLPGTGVELPARDVRLKLDTEAGRLELTTTRSDINTQHLLEQGEYLGLRLADLGFTGREDFEISVTVPNIPALHAVGQFGLYAGPRSDRNIRGGLISRSEPERYGQFLVNNDAGRDTDLNVVGILSSGDDMHLILRRKDGRYALSVENRSTGSSSTLTIRHPEFLDAEKDLHVGFFAADPQSDVPRTLLIKDMSVTVWAQRER